VQDTGQSPRGPDNTTQLQGLRRSQAADSIHPLCPATAVLTCVLAVVQEGTVLQQLLQHAFVSIPHLRQVLLVTSLDFDADIQQQQKQHQAAAVPDAAATLFVKASNNSSTRLWLYDCSRHDVLPAFQVRAMCLATVQGPSVLCALSLCCLPSCQVGLRLGHVRAPQQSLSCALLADTPGPGGGP
jgi:hypothetical protein